MSRWKRLVKHGAQEAASGVLTVAMSFLWMVALPTLAAFVVGWIGRGLVFGVIGALVVGVIAIGIWSIRHGVVPWD